MTTDIVQQDMLTVLRGQPEPVVTRWTYNASDPFAVSLAIRSRGDRWWVEWLVARDLVVEAITDPAGEGDVRMRPHIVRGHDIVEIVLISHNGRAVLEIHRDLLRQFVDATFEVVGPGEEADWMDLDEVIARIHQ